MTWLLCGLGAAVVLLAAWVAAERLGRLNERRWRVAAETEAWRLRGRVKRHEAEMMAQLRPYLPPAEGVR
jgi:hypothetical protein